MLTPPLSVGALAALTTVGSPQFAALLAAGSVIGVAVLLGTRAARGGHSRPDMALTHESRAGTYGAALAAWCQHRGAAAARDARHVKVVASALPSGVGVAVALHATREGRLVATMQSRLMPSLMDAVRMRLTNCGVLHTPVYAADEGLVALRVPLGQPGEDAARCARDLIEATAAVLRPYASGTEDGPGRLEITTLYPAPELNPRDLSPSPEVVPGPT